MSGNRGDLEIPDQGLIQTGPEPEQQQPEHRELSAREVAMARIYEKADAQREMQMEAADQEVEQRPEHDLARDDYAEEEPPQQRQAPARRQQQDAGQPPLQAVEIDGQTVWATPSQVTELARMGALAQREIARYNQQQARGWQQPHYQQQSVPEPQQSPVDPERVREVIRQIQYGSEQDAAEAFTGFVGDLVARQDPERVVNRNFHEIQLQQKLAADVELVKREFPDVIGDKIRARAAAQELEVLRQWNAQTGGQYDDVALLREAGNRVRASFGTPPEQGGQRQSYQSGNLVVRRSVSDIEDRKRNAPRALSGIDRRSAAPQQSRAPSASEVVSWLRAQRGQS
jgi:hypothetical protein